MAGMKKLPYRIVGTVKTSDKNRPTDDAQLAAWNTLYGDMGQGQRAERYADLAYLYNQENAKYGQGYGLTDSREMRDTYRDAWKTLYGNAYDNPYWTGNWYGQGQNVKDLATRADGWTNELSQYQHTQAAPQAQAAGQTMIAAPNAVQNALKTIVGTPVSVGAKGTRSTYGGSVA